MFVGRPGQGEKYAGRSTWRLSLLVCFLTFARLADLCLSFPASHLTIGQLGLQIRRSCVQPHMGVGDPDWDLKLV